MLRRDHEEEVERVPAEVGEREENGATPQKGLSPEPAESLDELRPQAPFGNCHLLLERDPDRDHRREREHVRDGVEEERERASEAEQEPAQGRPDEDRRVDAPRLLGGGCGRDLLLGNDRPERADLGDVEEGERGPVDERHGEDERERRIPAGDRRDQAPEREGAHDVRHDHHPLAVPAIRDQAGGKDEQRVREDPGEGDEARLGRRVRHREHEQRVRDDGGLVPQRGEQLARLEQDEVAVLAERRCAHRASIVSHVPATGSTGSRSSTAPSSTTPTGVGSSTAAHDEAISASQPAAASASSSGSR